MFNEQNSVENLIRDLLCGPQAQYSHVLKTGEEQAVYLPNGRNRKGAGWYAVPAHILPRHINEVFVEAYARQALIRLNPCIAEQPERAEEVLYRLRAIVLSARSDGLIHANEEFTAWLRGERSMPFGEHNQHVTIRLIDFDDLDQNQYVASTQFTYRAGPAERRADLVLLVNGFPLALVEAKTPVRQSVSWFDGAKQIHEDYERFVPELFVPNVFSAATEGKELRYGAVGTPLDQWGPWRPDEALAPGRPGRPAQDGPVAVPARGGARHPGALHPVRHRQAQAQHQSGLPLPAVRGGQQDRRARAGRLRRARD